MYFDFEVDKQRNMKMIRCMLNNLCRLLYVQFSKRASLPCIRWLVQLIWQWTSISSMFQRALAISDGCTSESPIMNQKTTRNPSGFLMRKIGLCLKSEKDKLACINIKQLLAWLLIEKQLLCQTSYFLYM